MTTPEAPTTVKGHALVIRLMATPARRLANKDVNWSAWVAAIEDEARAAIRAESSAEIDVDRLRHALIRADEAMGNHYTETFPLDLTPAGWPRFAEAVATAYRALAPADAAGREDDLAKWQGTTHDDAAARTEA